MLLQRFASINLAGQLPEEAALLGPRFGASEHLGHGKWAVAVD